jgi:hypothetical protein
MGSCRMSGKVIHLLGFWVQQTLAAEGVMMVS